MRHPWQAGSRRWFRLPVERIVRADAFGAVYAFYRPDGKSVAWFWRRSAARIVAGLLNEIEDAQEQGGSDANGDR